MAYILASGKQQYFDLNGDPLVGGRLWTMQPGPGVTTPKNTWSDAGETALNTNPIILNSRGEAQVFWSGAYNVRLETAAGGLIWTVENITTAVPDDVLRSDLASTAIGKGAAQIGRAETVVDTIAGLRALLKTSPSAYAFVSGYYAAGDGGGGAYYYDSADTTTADNGGTVIVAADGGRWKLTDSRTVGLEQFGGGASRSISENGAAADRACFWCFQSGATLRLRAGVTYAGARLEVHGTMSVEGNGATVDYLGVGYTLILGTGSGGAAVPTPWGLDPSIYNASFYLPTLYGISAPVAIGDNSIQLAGVTGLAAGDLVFVAGNPSSASSPDNYIPTSFEFAQVLSVIGNVVTFNGDIRNTYTTAGCVVKCAGIAKGGTISNVRLKATMGEAYQLVIRSAFSVVLDNIEFAGQDTLGAATFAESLQLRNFRSSGTDGSWSFARGIVSASLDGMVFQYRSGATSEKNAIFVEESWYKISLRDILCFGGSFSIRQSDMAGTVLKRSVAIEDSVFDTRYSPGGAASPFSVGNAAGVDIDVINCLFAGEVVTPAAAQYPGISGAALTWVSSNQPLDRIKFSACHFISFSAGAAFKAGSGVTGSVLFDRMCTFDVCSEPVTAYTPRGAWVNMSAGLLSGFTVTSGQVAQYRVQDKQVYFKGRLDRNGAVAGTNFFLMPAGVRPLTEARDVCATDGAGTFATLRVSAVGDFFYVGSSGTPTYIQLDGFSYPIDA